MNRLRLIKITAASLAVIATGVILKKFLERMKTYGKVKICKSKREDC